MGDPSWLILTVYVIGHLLTWITIWRMALLDPILGVREDDGRGATLFTVTFFGFIMFCVALFWPFVALILIVFKYLVKPGYLRDRDRNR